MNHRETKDARERDATPLGDLLRWLHGGGADDELALIVALEFASGDGPSPREAGNTLRSFLAGPAYASGVEGG
jgi:hypothetical protein